MESKWTEAQARGGRNVCRWLLIVMLIVTPAFAEDVDRPVEVRRDGLTLRIIPDGFRFAFDNDALGVHIPAHPESGLLLGPPGRLRAAHLTADLGESDGTHRFAVESEDGLRAVVAVRLEPTHAHFSVRPDPAAGMSILLRVAGLSPGYGLGDNYVMWVYPETRGPGRPGRGTEITGFSSDMFNGASTGRTRMVSNFAIYPRHRFALVNIDPGNKIVRSLEQEVGQGSVSTAHLTDMHFFFGDPKTIYQNYRRVLEQADYASSRPKPAMFGVGWEAYGALAWRTSAQTVRQDVDQYLALGVPLRWMVIGSGFWDAREPSLLATTSFGLWNHQLYPDPEALKAYFRDKGLMLMVGLRIAFTHDGPFTAEGLERGFFLKENGRPILTQVAFPRRPAYLLNTFDPRAVDWYVRLCDHWGVDGFKEDLFGYASFQRRHGWRDDKLNPVNAALSARGYHVMGRSAYLVSPSEIHRIEDFNYNQDQDRGPINTLTLAYSGFPAPYPDIVGGQFGGMDFDGETSPRIRTYMMRSVWFAALHPSMSVGKGPWHFGDPDVVDAVVSATKLHDRLAPYIYSQAVRANRDGFPWPMTPLPLAYPDDPAVHGRENPSVRGYQWMIGDALLATPLYGEDYDTAQTRDVYLPEGVWIEYDSGRRHRGPVTLHDHPLPADQAPLFVGGTGVVIERIEGRLFARVYEVSGEAMVDFHHPNGRSISRITVAHPRWDSPRITDLTDPTAVRAERVRHAWQFAIEPGHDYRVE